jgi:Icc-related predicted phosphoesterase
MPGLLQRRRRKRASTSPATDRLTLYYASDVHGSEECWRKFLGAAKFYKAQVLVMGGDLTGKAIVPVTRSQKGMHKAVFLGETRTASTEEELEQLVGAIRYNGFYPWIADAAAIAQVADDPAAQERLFEEIMADEVRRWVALGDERLAGTSVEAYVMAGNDDPWSIDESLSGAERIKLCDERIVEVHGHEMISSSYANPTPWDSPRELSEEDLYRRLDALAQQLERPERAIFNLHVPPFDSGLDTATEINADLTVATRKGEPIEAPVGSHAVRQLIEEYQPLLAVHGHIHESRGAAHIGRTLALNSGSEYNTGRLHGVRVVLEADAVVSHQFVVG